VLGCPPRSGRRGLAADRDAENETVHAIHEVVIGVAVVVSKRILDGVDRVDRRDLCHVAGEVTMKDPPAGPIRRPRDRYIVAELYPFGDGHALLRGGVDLVDAGHHVPVRVHAKVEPVQVHGM